MKIIRLWGPVILWMGVIFFFSTRTRIVVSQVYSINFLFFKTLHVIEYAFLYVLLFRAMKSSFPQKHVRFWVAWSFIILFLYAASDEIHQLFVVTREGTVRDVIIDTLGGTIAWIFITRLLPKSPKKLQKWAKIWLAI